MAALMRAEIADKDDPPPIFEPFKVWRKACFC
jgi:hypothetical protein